MCRLDVSRRIGLLAALVAFAAPSTGRAGVSGGIGARLHAAARAIRLSPPLGGLASRIHLPQISGSHRLSRPGKTDPASAPSKSHPRRAQKLSSPRLTPSSYYGGIAAVALRRLAAPGSHGTPSAEAQKIISSPRRAASLFGGIVNSISVAKSRSNNPPARIWGAHFSSLATNRPPRGTLVNRLGVERTKNGSIRYTCPVGNQIQVSPQSGRYKIYENHGGKLTLVHKGMTDKLRGLDVSTIGPASRSQMEKQLRTVLGDVAKNQGTPKVGAAFLPLLNSPIKIRKGDLHIGQLLVHAKGHVVSATCPVGITVSVNVKTGGYAVYRSNFDQPGKNPIKYFQKNLEYAGKLTPKQLREFTAGTSVRKS